MLRGRIDDSHGVEYYSPSRHLFTEILFCTLIDTDREIDTDRHQENFQSSENSTTGVWNTARALPPPAAEGLWARAPGYSAAPRLARGMNPTMDLESAITISLSQWVALGSTGVKAPEVASRGNYPLTRTCGLWRSVRV
jgi:hypothetical protein